MIELTNVYKRYGGVEALRGVSLKVERGGVTGLLGQNGAGKTTLINILTGYLAPTSGRALVDGHDPLLDPLNAKRRLGYLPEQPPLYDEMTVKEYLCFASELRGVVPRAIPAHVDEIMGLCGLGDMRGRLIGNLSKGYRQRAGLAQALCGDPEALVLDEPTVGLDPKQITEIRELIRSLSKGRTILFSSHILSEVKQLCDRVVILHMGTVKLDAPIKSLQSGDDTVIELTVGTGDISILDKLKALEGARSVEPRAADSGEISALVTFDKGGEPERRIFELLSGADAPILRLCRADDSLEQVFLRAVSGE